jgi:hypothetical protein
LGKAIAADWIGFGITAITAQATRQRQDVNISVCRRDFAQLVLFIAQGALQKKRRTPAWLIGSSEAPKKTGLVPKKSEIFCRVFLLPSPRYAQKRD